MKKLLTILSISLFTMAICKGQVKNESKRMRSADSIFPVNEKAPARFFTGNAYPYTLVKTDSIYTTLAGNVYFEPGARSNWHSHPSGQILIVIEGMGYHQIEGQAKEIIKKGDVVKCPPNTKHWHGASEDEGMSHIYIIPNTEKGIVEWLEPVSDKDYHN